MGFEKRNAVQKAISLTQQGQYDKAIAEYEVILRADPSDSSVYNTLGDLYAHIGLTQKAIACYQKLVGVLKAEGLLYRAIAVYKKVIKLDANNPSAWIGCADLYAQEGLRAEAKHHYLLAAERALKLGFDKQALDVYERLILLEPGDAGGAAKLASLLVAGGRRSEAADLLSRLAQEVRTLGKLDDARLLYKQMVEIAPEMFTGWYCLGRIEFETGRLQEAEEPLRRAAKIDANSPLPHLLLGQLYEHQMKPNLAKAAWQALLRCDPKHQEAHRRLGLLYLNEGDTEAAVKEFDDAARSLPESGELERAIALFGELGPGADHPLVQERLGELFERSARPTEAKAAFTRAAELHFAAGRAEERRRILSRLLALDPQDPGAMAGLPTGATVGSRLVTLEPTEHPSSDPSIIGNIFAAPGAVTSPQQAGEPPEEIFRTSGEPEQEGQTVLIAKRQSVERVPVPLAVIDVYLKQGNEAEARALLRRLVANEPDNVEAARRLESLESKALAGGAAVAPEIEVLQPDHLGRPEGSTIFGALFAELEPKRESSEEGTGVPQGEAGSDKGFVSQIVEPHGGLLPWESAPGPVASPVDQVRADSDAIPSPDRSPETCEAHYQLGIAYREMDLLDDAIAEFRRAAADEQLTLRACNMVGLCLLAKGNAEAAIHELGRSLSVGGRPPEEYHAIKYDLATAYQAIGYLNIAVTILRDLQTENPYFRDAKSRVRELEGQLAQGAGPSGSPEGSVDAARQTQSG